MYNFFSLPSHQRNTKHASYAYPTWVQLDTRSFLRKSIPSLLIGGFTDTTSSPAIDGMCVYYVIFEEHAVGCFTSNS